MSTPDEQTVKQLDLNQIQPNPHQPRKHLDPDELQDLADSIKTHGLLEPIVIAHTPAGYQIIAGERRWRASKLAGLETIPALVKKTSPRGMLEMSIVENVQRSDLNALERAHALNRLINEFGLTPSEVAKQINKSGSYISNSIKLLQLPDALKDGLLSGLISEGHARALQGIDNTKDMIEAYKTILKEEGSVRRAEELARRYKEKNGKKPTERTPKMQVSKEIDKWEQNLQKTLGKNAQVKLRRSYRQTEIRIKLKGSLDQTQPALEKILELTDQN